MLRGSDLEYYVNEEKRTVVAIARDIEYDVLDDLSRVCEGVAQGIIPTNASLYLPRVMKAKAKCSPSDEWNVEIGKRVARIKLFNHYNKVKSGLLKEYAKRLSVFEERVRKLSDDLKDRSEQEIKL